MASGCSVVPGLLERRHRVPPGIEVAALLAGVLGRNPGGLEDEGAQASGVRPGGSGWSGWSGWSGRSGAPGIGTSTERTTCLLGLPALGLPVVGALGEVPHDEPPVLVRLLAHRGPQPSLVDHGVVALAQQSPVNRLAIVYLNRLSDLLFILARDANRGRGGDVLWEPGGGQTGSGADAGGVPPTSPEVA